MSCSCFYDLIACFFFYRWTSAPCSLQEAIFGHSYQVGALRGPRSSSAAQTAPQKLRCATVVWLCLLTNVVLRSSCGEVLLAEPLQLSDGTSLLIVTGGKCYAASEMLVEHSGSFVLYQRLRLANQTRDIV